MTTATDNKTLIPAKIAPIGSHNGMVLGVNVQFAASAKDKNAVDTKIDLNKSPATFFSGYEDGTYVIRTNLKDLGQIFARKSGDQIFIGSEYDEVSDLTIDTDNPVMVSSKLEANITLSRLIAKELLPA